MRFLYWPKAPKESSTAFYYVACYNVDNCMEQYASLCGDQLKLSMLFMGDSGH